MIHILWDKTEGVRWIEGGGGGGEGGGGGGGGGGGAERSRVRGAEY